MLEEAPFLCYTYRTATQKTKVAGEHMNVLDCLFRPSSIALVGASPEAGHIGGIVFDNLRRYRGNLYPVNPRHKELGGLACYRSIGEIPETVDLSVILRPAAEVPGILLEHAGKARCAVIVSSGFSEIGDAALQQEVLQDARNLGIRFVGPNCLGVFNPYNRLDTFFLPQDRFRRPKKGNVAVVSQSGGLLICILEALALVGRGVSRGVNYGNAADIDAPEIFEYLAEDPDTDVVVSYLESVGEGRRFIEAAKKLASRKPLLILKAGKGEGGQSAAYSHTGRLAGKYEVFASLLRQTGVREAGDFEELLDAGHALSHQRQGEGNRVCIITNAGGLGVLAADEASRQGLTLSPLPKKVWSRLHDSFPPFYCFGNPIDLTGQVEDEQYLFTLTQIRDHYDGFIIIAHTGVAGVTLRLADVLTRFRAECSKPVVAHLAPGGITAPLAKRLEAIGIPVYPSPERGMRGLRALLTEPGEGAW